MNSLDGGQYGRIIGGIIELIASNGYPDGNASHTWWAKSKTAKMAVIWYCAPQTVIVIVIGFS